MTERHRALRTVLLGIALSLADRPALADPPAARVVLDYDRGTGGAFCPDDAAFRGGVARRLGYDPFESDARRRVEVTLARSPSGYSAHIVVGGVDGVGDATRDLSTEGGSCDELIDSVVLAVSLAIDPLSFAHPQPAQTPEAPPPAPPPAVKATAPAAPLSPPPSPSLWSLYLTGAARTGLGLVPGPASIGPVVAFSARRKALELFVDGGVDVPLGTATVQGAESPVEATLLHAGVGACAHLGWIALCGRFDGGSLEGSTTTTQLSSVKFYADLAASAGIDAPLRYGLRLEAGVEALVPLETIELDAGIRVWKTPDLAGALFVGLGYRL